MSISSTGILPQPFAWVHIPAGKVTLIPEAELKFVKERVGYIADGMPQTFDTDTFEMAKYPVTNAQFAVFIAADGYNQRRWWTDEGWQMKLESGWTQPQFWQDAKWNKPDYPVVGVSWYEALAFCNWLTEVTGENVRLPTEQEWQRAAQGDNTNWYVAWGGSDDDEPRCNWDGLWGWETDGTTPVTRFEGKGDSPYGVVDMTGNVWEWCSTKYFTGENDLKGDDIRILKGGSWVLYYSYVINIRVTDRYGLNPFHRLDHAGFRCARSIPSTHRI